MDDRICPLVSGRNGVLVSCLGSACHACRTAVNGESGETVNHCAACLRPPIEGGR